MGNIIFNKNELQLVEIVQNNNSPQYLTQFALDTLYTKYYKLVVSIAHMYKQPECDIEDLIQEGFRGLLIGIKKFDTTSGVKLSTYVFNWIRNSIERSLPTNGWFIKTPYNLKQEAKLLAQSKQEYFDKYGYSPSVKDLAKFLGWKESKVLKVSRSCKHVASIDTIIVNDSRRETSFADFVEDDKPSAEKQMIKDEQQQNLSKMLKETLNDREYQIIALQFGFNGEPMQIKDIAKKFKLSQARIKQILKSIRIKISNSKNLKSLYDNWVH